MTATAERPAAPIRLNPAQVLAELFRRQALLAGLGLLFLAALVPVLMLTSADPRLLDGAEVWAKPAKFLGSLSMYCLTTAWFFGYVDPAFRQGRAGRLIARGIAAASLFEIAYIIFQASRGERSHFNTADPLHIALYGLMGLAAVGLVGMSLVLAGLIVRRPAPGLRPAWRDAVVLGLVLTFTLGGGLGGYMSAQTGHAVGAAGGGIGGASLPLFGWSTVGGDLRPPHFFGIHAEQFLPFFALFVPGRGLASRLAVWIAAIAYVAFTLAVFAQALSGRPFLAI
jgi:hypothetical protein